MSAVSAGPPISRCFCAITRQGPRPPRADGAHPGGTRPAPRWDWIRGGKYHSKEINKKDRRQEQAQERRVQEVTAAQEQEQEQEQVQEVSAV